MKKLLSVIGEAYGDLLMKRLVSVLIEESRSKLQIKPEMHHEGVFFKSGVVLKVEKPKKGERYEE